MRALVSLLLAAAPLLAACPSTHHPNPAPDLTVAELLGTLGERRSLAQSFRSDSVMDYWLGSDRVKGTVKVMGTPGAKVRFNALDPADNVLADLACDGYGFVYVDRRNNCVMTGPCNQASIAQLLRVALSPDDFFYLALGSTPVLADAQATMTWDADKGYQRVELAGVGGSQSIVLDGRDATWDVLKSELRRPDGEIVWSVTNTDFEAVTDDAGVALRMPGKTRFRSPDEKADLLIDWKSRDVNVTLPEAAFTLEPPPGLATCQAAR
ncbi:MAG: hypothetical protein R2939_10225 [Kofleriaceae bacterium]